MIFCPLLKNLCLTNDFCSLNKNVCLKDVCQSSICLFLVTTYIIIGILLITLGWYMMEQQQQGIFDIKKIFEQQHQGIFEQQKNNKCILEEQECPQMLCNSSNYLVISILMLFLFVVNYLSNMFIHFMKFLMFATLFAILVVCLITFGWIAYNKYK
jgi:hypothetical protein